MITERQKVHKTVRDIRYDSNTCDGDLYMDVTIEMLFDDIKNLIGISVIKQYDKNRLIYNINELKRKWEE